jgi:hypothetical protein
MRGTAMTATSTPRPTSQTIMIARRGYRSASPDSSRLPANTGTTLAANVSAASSADWVRL